LQYTSAGKALNGKGKGPEQTRVVGKGKGAKHTTTGVEPASILKKGTKAGKGKWKGAEHASNGVEQASMGKNNAWEGAELASNGVEQASMSKNNAELDMGRGDAHLYTIMYISIDYSYYNLLYLSNGVYMRLSK
jgi:hypothetical protein